MVCYKWPPLQDNSQKSERGISVGCHSLGVGMRCSAQTTHLQQGTGWCLWTRTHSAEMSFEKHGLDRAPRRIPPRVGAHLRQGLFWSLNMEPSLSLCLTEKLCLLEHKALRREGPVPWALDCRCPELSRNTELLWRWEN